MRRSARISAAPAAALAKIEDAVAVKRVRVVKTKAVERQAVAGKRSLTTGPSAAATSVVRTKKIKTEFVVETAKALDAVAAKRDAVSSASAVKADPSSACVVENADGDRWSDLCSTRELSCAVTLTSGQVFTWQRYAGTDAWVGVVGERVYKLRERGERVQYQLLHPRHLRSEQARAALDDYFRLEVEAGPLYDTWTETDDNMSKIIRSLPGLRIVRQDPVECLFAFICSSNNNIQRITQMITKLKATYGELLFKDSLSGITFHAFPTVEALASRAEEQTLRDLGFGYRAPFIIKSSHLLKELGSLEYLLKLRETPASADDDEYAEKLMAFSGVGRKVADCVGLFALNKLHAIPVDTHVWQIACREFDPSLQSKKSLTPTIYKAVGDHFRARFSPLAGWAHSVLFTGDLTSFQTHLPQDMQKKKQTKTMKVKTEHASEPTKSKKRKVVALDSNDIVKAEAVKEATATNSSGRKRKSP